MGGAFNRHDCRAKLVASCSRAGSKISTYLGRLPHPIHASTAPSSRPLSSRHIYVYALGARPVEAIVSVAGVQHRMLDATLVAKRSGSTPSARFRPVTLRHRRQPRRARSFPIENPEPIRYAAPVIGRGQNIWVRQCGVNITGRMTPSGHVASSGPPRPICPWGSGIRGLV
jgi:hypothetical protein